MSTKIKTTTKTVQSSRVAASRPTKGAKPKRSIRAVQTLRSAIDAFESSNDRLAALQLLDAKNAVIFSQITDAPVSDASPVTLFTSKVVAVFSGFDDGNTTNGYCRFAAFPRPNQHFLRTTAATNGVPTAQSWASVENYSALASNFDDLRCAAIALQVKYTGTALNANGIMRCGTFNPNGDLNWNPSTGINPDDFCSAPCNPLHFMRMPWIPARPEVDHAFVATTSADNNQTSAVWFDWTGAKNATTPLPSFEVEIYSIWAGRPLPTLGLLATPRVFLNSQVEFEKELLALLAEVPLYAQQRIMFADDGSDLNPVSTVIDAGRKAWDGASRLFGRGRSFTDRASGAFDMFRSLGTIGTFFGGLFSDDELLLRRLAGLSKDQLDTLRLLLIAHKETPSSWVDHHIDYYRAKRHRCGGRRTHLSVLPRHSSPCDCLALAPMDWEPVREEDDEKCPPPSLDSRQGQISTKRMRL